MCAHGDTVVKRVWVPARLAHDGKDGWRDKPIDRCIAPIVGALLAGGVGTVGSCCGHGKNPGSIVLDDGRELIIAANRDEAKRMQAIYGTGKETS